MKNLENFGIKHKLDDNIILTEPIGYIDFIKCTKNAELILTDSGGIQEESTFLGVQCITLRTTTERPITVELGTNQLLGTNLEKAKDATFNVLNGIIKKGTIPPLWDGKAAERICAILHDKLYA
jgi:UDP-N-acetylglucosamine 2-epimerase (non-hydrolysing)